MSQADVIASIEEYIILIIWFRYYIANVTSLYQSRIS